MAREDVEAAVEGRTDEQLWPVTTTKLLHGLAEID